MNTLIDQLADQLLSRINPPIPLSVELWDKSHIGQYLIASSTVIDSYISLPGFPQAIRLPNMRGGRSHPRWKAKEVIAWAEKYQERRVA